MRYQELSRRISPIFPRSARPGGRWRPLRITAKKIYSGDRRLNRIELDPDLKSSTLPRTLFLNNLALDLMAVGRTDKARNRLIKALAMSDDAGLKELLGTAYARLRGICKMPSDTGGNPSSWTRKTPMHAWDWARLAMARRQWEQAVGYLRGPTHKCSPRLLSRYTT